MTGSLISGKVEVRLRTGPTADRATAGRKVISRPDAERTIGPQTIGAPGKSRVRTTRDGAMGGLMADSHEKMVTPPAGTASGVPMPPEARPAASNVMSLNRTS